MYAFPEMLKLIGIVWKSEAHKQVATLLLIGNRRVTTCSQLTEYCTIINNLTEKKVKTITIEDIAKLGIPIN